MHFAQIVIWLLNALTGASLLVIVALGLTVIVGMMGVINLAHGELMMLGAFTVVVLTQAKVPLILAMLTAPIVSGLVGLLMFLSKRIFQCLILKFAVWMPLPYQV